MATSALSRRYADALISIAKDNKSVDAIGADLNHFIEAWDEADGMLRRAMLNPGISMDQRRSVLSAVLEKLSLNPTAQNAIKLLFDKGRLQLLSEVHEAYESMADAHIGRMRAKVTTATEIDMLEQTKIRETLADVSGISADKLIVHFGIDPSLIGGVVARVGDTIYDASIRSRLVDIQNALI